MPMPQTLHSFLDERRIPYEAIHHRRDYTSQHTAADTHTPGKDFAKVIMLSVNNSYGLFVVPATGQVDLEKVKRLLDARTVRLATENEIARICPDCEIGAMPPFGVLSNLQVYVSPHLIDDHLITFNAGTHEDAVRMLYTDFEKVAQPVVMDFTVEN